MSTHNGDNDGDVDKDEYTRAKKEDVEKKRIHMGFPQSRFAFEHVLTSNMARCKDKDGIIKKTIVDCYEKNLASKSVMTKRNFKDEAWYIDFINEIIKEWKLLPLSYQSTIEASMEIIGSAIDHSLSERCVIIPENISKSHSTLSCFSSPSTQRIVIFPNDYRLGRFISDDLFYAGEEHGWIAEKVGDVCGDWLKGQVKDELAIDVMLETLIPKAIFSDRSYSLNLHSYYFKCTLPLAKKSLLKLGFVHEINEKD